jgi:hypothetical protein
MQEVASGVWVEHGYGSGNVGFVVTGSGVVCVDVPMMPDDAHHWLYSIRQVTDEPIISLVQTDYDQSRFLSTRLVEARLIAHEAAWEGNHLPHLSGVRQPAAAHGRAPCAVCVCAHRGPGRRGGRPLS